MQVVSEWDVIFDLVELEVGEGRVSGSWANKVVLRSIGLPRDVSLCLLVHLIGLLGVGGILRL